MKFWVRHWTWKLEKEPKQDILMSGFEPRPIHKKPCLETASRRDACLETPSLKVPLNKRKLKGSDELHAAPLWQCRVSAIFCAVLYANVLNYLFSATKAINLRYKETCCNWKTDGHTYNNPWRKSKYLKYKMLYAKNFCKQLTVTHTNSS